MMGVVYVVGACMFGAWCAGMWGGGARVCDMVCVVHGCQGVVWMHVV